MQCVCCACTSPTFLCVPFKRTQHCWPVLQWTRNKEMLELVGSKVWNLILFWFEAFKFHATTCNNIQQGVQPHAKCCVQQCWERFTQPFRSLQSIVSTSGCQIIIIVYHEYSWLEVYQYWKWYFTFWKILFLITAHVDNAMYQRLSVNVCMCIAAMRFIKA